MIYLDANALIALVVNIAEESRTEQMERLMRAAKEPIFVSPLADYEARKHLLAIGNREWESRLKLLYEQRLTLISGGWEPAVLQALKLARQFKARLIVDSADTLHVGWSLAIGAGTFASFDRAHGPRALALCQGLKLWPEANSADYQSMSRLKPVTK
jgi:predicted nucleic acid-binding protein